MVFSVGDRGPRLPISCGVITLFTSFFFGWDVEELEWVVSEDLDGVEV